MGLRDLLGPVVASVAASTLNQLPRKQERETDDGLGRTCQSPVAAVVGLARFTGRQLSLANAWKRGFVRSLQVSRGQRQW